MTFGKHAHFKADKHNAYFELDSTHDLIKVHRPHFGHKIIPSTIIRGYRLTMDDHVIVASDGSKPALIDNNLLSDAHIMGVLTPGTEEIYHLNLELETTQGPIVIKYINTRVQIGTLVYSVALLDANKALQELDQLPATKRAADLTDSAE